MTSKNNLTFVTFYQYLLQNYVCVVRYQRQIVIRRIIQMEVLCKEDALIDTKRFLSQMENCGMTSLSRFFFFTRTYITRRRNPTSKGNSIKM